MMADPDERTSAVLESVLGASPRGFESLILRHRERAAFPRRIAAAGSAGIVGLRREALQRAYARHARPVSCFKGASCDRRRPGDSDLTSGRCTRAAAAAS